ncbi:MAG: precorrin-6Y C5,15-methyltransferase (decarboxylating) subunit CbiT [Synergistaceae bacterium]|jgi:precorrin-6Y C5,15-methyltransferase (decarboxylating) CbiT subunit|nr:precorrin-6Y C5,15-methyltransferase (decarboxylating) subunit CbiT [Synergistaceae bacterium]
MLEEGQAALGRGVIDDEWFLRNDRVPMTKAPLRSMIVSLLSPLRGASVLEIGSGTGAVTVELARAVGRSGRVTSVEASPLALGVARANLERAGVSDRVELTAGKAPKHMPDGTYDAAFIGGHGEALEVIIGECFARLNDGGRLLLTALMPGTASRALSYLGGLGVSAGFWRIHSSVGRKTASDWLLQGNNPIDLIWGDK